MSTLQDAQPFEAPPFNILNALFSFKGRLRRQHYFVCMIFMLAGGIVYSTHPIATAILHFPLVWCGLATTTKRLHDIEYSGWLSVILVIPPFFALLISSLLISAGASGLLFPLFLLLFAFLVGWQIWLLTADGTSGANLYGPDPKLPLPAK